MKRRIIITLGVLLVALPLGCGVYEATAAAGLAKRFPPPGRLIDIGGRRLHVLCIGSGRPTVMFEQSGLSNSASGEAARSWLAAHATVCSYDRAGVGWSDPGPDPMSVGSLTEDLKQLQERAALVPPFVFVASSMGGVVSEMFARRYPDLVAGLVMVDAGNSALLGIAASEAHAREMSEINVVCRAVSGAGRIGLIRMYDPFAFRRVHSADAERSAALMYDTKPWSAVCAAVRGMRDSFGEFARTPPLRGDLPIVALSAERPDNLLPPMIPERLGRDAMKLLYASLTSTSQTMARRSTKGSWRLVRNTGHLIASDQPQAVVDATLDVMSLVRGR